MTRVCIFLALFCFFIDLLQCGKLKLPKPNISPECEMDGICDHVENYPTDLVKSLIERLESESTIFNYDQAPLPSFKTRFNDFDQEPMGLCETKPRYVPVKAAKDKNGIWQYIINDSKKPVQVFRTEICRKHLGRCSENIGFGPGYDGACLQKMLFREMFFINETKEVNVGYFEVPICCTCTLIRKDNEK